MGDFWTKAFMGQLSVFWFSASPAETKVARCSRRYPYNPAVLISLSGVARESRVLHLPRLDAEQEQEIRLCRVEPSRF